MMKIDKQATVCISNRLRIDKRHAPLAPSAVKEDDDTCKPPPRHQPHPFLTAVGWLIHIVCASAEAASAASL